jgi:hypothetical protein
MTVIGVLLVSLLLLLFVSAMVGGWWGGDGCVVCYFDLLFWVIGVFSPTSSFVFGEWMGMELRFNTGLTLVTGLSISQKNNHTQHVPK